MSESSPLKAGHPPAVKVGGKRIVTKQKQHKTDQDGDAFDEKYQDTTVYNPMGPVKVDITAAGGTPPQEKSRSEYVKTPHDPPHASKEKHSTPKKPQIIQQPR